MGLRDWPAVPDPRGSPCPRMGDRLSPDSRLLASSSDDVKIWDVATGDERARFTGHDRLVVALAFHPTRPWVMSGGYDGTVRLWDLNTGRALGVLYRVDGAVNGVAIRPDGRWIGACYSDGRARLWNLDRTLSFPMPPDRVLEGCEGALWSVGFDADGRTLAAGSERRAIVLWDGSTLDRLTTLRGGTGQIRNVSFSRDGGLLAGSAYAAPTILWDLVGVRKALREMCLDWRPGLVAPDGTTARGFACRGGTR